MFAHIPHGVIERAFLWLAAIGVVATVMIAGVVWLVVFLLTQRRKDSQDD